MTQRVIEDSPPVLQQHSCHETFQQIPTSVLVPDLSSASRDLFLKTILQWMSPHRKKSVCPSVTMYVYIYEVYCWIGPIQSAQYMSRAGYTMFVKKKRFLQHCLYNAVLFIFHKMVWIMSLSLKRQMCLLSSVEVLECAWLNNDVWFLYLVLRLFSVSPTYVSEVLLSVSVTMAW